MVYRNFNISACISSSHYYCLKCCTILRFFYIIGLGLVYDVKIKLDLSILPLSWLLTVRLCWEQISNLASLLAFDGLIVLIIDGGRNLGISRGGPR